MKDCTGCAFADWQTTKAGKLHPSGDGMCTKTVKIPPLPAAKYWLSPFHQPSGGYINRRSENTEHCVYYQLKKKA